MIKKGQRFISDMGSVVVIKSYTEGYSLTYQVEDTEREYTVSLEGTDERFLNVFKPLINKLMTTKELADKLDVHTNSVYNWRKEGMPYVIAGRNCRYDYEEVKQWLKDNKGGQ